jgi:multidrug efflux pump subunit AcrA (membrane-fusion protein)
MAEQPKSDAQKEAELKQQQEAAQRQQQEAAQRQQQEAAQRQQQEAAQRQQQEAAQRIPPTGGSGTAPPSTQAGRQRQGFANNPRASEPQLTVEERRKQQEAGPRVEGMRHGVVVDPTRTVLSNFPGLNYDLSELWSNIRDGSYFTAVKRAVWLLNTILNPDTTKGTGGVVAARPAHMRPPGRVAFTPPSQQQETETEGYVNSLREWCDRAETMHPEAAATMASERHPAAESVSASDLQIIVSLILRLLGK